MDGEMVKFPDLTPGTTGECEATPNLKAQMDHHGTSDHKTVSGIRASWIHSL